ncbi:MAG: hypothetical protein F6K14_00840 [Symploca sp. SIO2C1]|nr:hypothetical protein [Symploca sp. SIO2C1]
MTNNKQQTTNNKQQYRLLKEEKGTRYLEAVDPVHRAPDWFRRRFGCDKIQRLDLDQWEPARINSHYQATQEDIDDAMSLLPLAQSWEEFQQIMGAFGFSDIQKLTIKGFMRAAGHGERIHQLYNEWKAQKDLDF